MRRVALAALPEASAAVLVLVLLHTGRDRCRFPESATARRAPPPPPICRRSSTGCATRPAAPLAIVTLAAATLLTQLVVA